jgi:DNA-binding protein Fis
MWALDKDESVVEDQPTIEVNVNSNKPIIKLSELEIVYIDAVMKFTLGNKAKTAKLLGIDRRTLYRKLQRES